MKKLFNIIPIVIMVILWIWYAFDVFSQEIPKPIGYVNDFANVLTIGEEKTLEAILKDYEAKSTVEIVIVTIKSLDGYTIEEYANKLANTWGVGKKNKNNGLVILNSINDRKWRIEVGYGLEEFITDAYAVNLGNTYLTPNLKNGKYFDAYKSTIEQIMKRLGNLTEDDKQRIRDDNNGKSLKNIITIIIIGLIIIFIIIMIVSYNIPGSGGGIFSSGSTHSGGFGGGSFGGGGASGKY